MSTTPLTTGGRVRTIPSKMTTPYDNPLLTNANSITVRWAALTGTASGNSPIVTYKLMWDAGSGTVGSTLIEGDALTFTVHGLVLG